MKNNYLLPQILLTVVALEFFGPAIRDSGHSHLMNEEWVGHARLHMAWAIGFMVASGIANIYFIWRKSADKLHDFTITLIWQGCNLAGFWIAIITLNLYGGAIIDPNHHIAIFGIDENLVAFTGFSLVYLAAFYVVKVRGKTSHQA